MCTIMRMLPVLVPHMVMFHKMYLVQADYADNQKTFKHELKKFLCNHTFYTMEEYLTHS
jgi:hypothetical protein